MKTIEINNYKLNIIDIKSYIENNEVYSKLEYCDRKDADVKIVVKDKINGKRTQYTDYLKFI